MIGIIGAAFTAVYMTRLIFLTFYGNERFAAAPAPAEPALPVVSGGADDAEVAVEEGDPALDHDPAGPLLEGR